MLIQKSENQDIEFKQSWQDEYLKWICAFANTKGGILYIGVNDKGTVTGVQDFHKLSETIPLKITQSMGLLCDVSVADDSDNNLKYLIIKVNMKTLLVFMGNTTKELAQLHRKLQALN